MNKLTKSSSASYIYIYVSIALFSFTLLSAFVLLSTSTSAADAVDTINLTIPEACTLSTSTGSGQTYNAQISNGQYKNDIGKTRLNVFCNTASSFAIYAIGYSNDTIGNNEMITTTSGATNILTGTATSGDTSNWAMKIEPATGTAGAYTPTVLSPFNDFTAVPSDYTKIAEVASVATGIAAEAAIDTSYAVYISPKQSSGSYQGKVKYTMVHPNDANPPFDSRKVAYLDTGPNVSKKMANQATLKQNWGYQCVDNGPYEYMDLPFIRSIKKGAALPSNFIPTEENTISLPSSPKPVYIYYDESDYSINYYSEGEVIYMNSDSSQIFEIAGVTDIMGDCSHEAMSSEAILTDISGAAGWDATYVTKISSLFGYTYVSDNISIAPLANWNVSNVTDMSGLFKDLCWGFDERVNLSLAPIANWDVRNVTDMSYAFSDSCIDDFTPLANWDVSNVTNMSWMFLDGLHPNKQISDLAPLANWDVSNVTDMSYMFRRTGISDLSPIKDWNVSNVTNMSEMFSETRISDLTPIANWNVDNATNMSWMFWDIPTLTNSSVISGWNVNKVTNFNGMLGGSTPKTNLPIFTSRPGTWDSKGTYIPNP